MSTGFADHKKIVVGFDGSTGAHRALEWALREADLRGAPLSVVRAWTPGEFGTDKEMLEYSRAELEKEVADLIASPTVPWQTAVRQGHAARVLLEEAADAQMLVVGSRGRGGFTGLALGSTSIQVTTHPGAAVVVIVKGEN
jgi:nucleotide-binding universal stress UspA family protein